MTNNELAAHELCKACGFCCDGTLFKRTLISRDHDTDALESGVFGNVQDQKALPQPCPALEAGICVLYKIRPYTCRKFRCVPLKKFLDNAASYEETMALITENRLNLEKTRKLMASARKDDSATLLEKRTAEFNHLVSLHKIKNIFKKKKAVKPVSAE